MLKVLLIAYACEPGKGSEQGTGWNLALKLAERFEVTVVTRSNNREVIEADAERATRPRLSFLYHDLPPAVLALKRRGLLPVQSYYGLWQFALAWRFLRDQAFSGFDLVHHLTFNSFEMPPLFLRFGSGLKVWGPVGGGQATEDGLLPALGKSAARKEHLRGLRVAASAWNPWVRRTLAACDLVLFANDETRHRLESSCRAKVGTMVDVGVDPARFFPTAKSGGKTVLFAGKFEPRKGTRLLLMAFREALTKDPELRLRMVGDGESLTADREWVKTAGLDGRIEFTGRRIHAEMAEEFAKADLFVFPSLRDTSGAIVLEAMACGLPTVCLDHQGARLMVDELSGIRVPVSDLTETTGGLASAIIRLASDPGLRETMGRHARQRVTAEFSWDSKAARLAAEYAELVAPRN